MHTGYLQWWDINFANMECQGILWHAKLRINELHGIKNLMMFVFPLSG